MVVLKQEQYQLINYDMRLIIFIICLFLSPFVIAQGVEQFQYFGDTTGGDFSHMYNKIEINDGVIISGKRKIGNKQSPVVIKINKNGEVVWSTANNNTYVNNEIGEFEISMFSDSLIYGYTHELASISHVFRFWKINPKNGDVIWIKDCFDPNARSVSMCEYDSLHFYVSVQNANNINHISLMEKNTGDTVSTLMYGYNLCKFAKDENFNLYIATGNTLTKYNKNDINDQLWSRTFNYLNVVNQNVTISKIERIYMDENENMFLFAIDAGSFGHGPGIVISVDKGSGNKNWITNTCNFEVKLSDFKDQDGFLYLTYQQTLVGSDDFKFRASKLNKVSGSLVWYKEYNVTPLGSPVGGHSFLGESALGLDTDCNGDVYLTGYYGDANYGPESWGVMKLGGLDGSKIYDLTITIDSANYDDLSSGIAVCVFENTPVILGHLEYVPGKYKPYFVTIEPQTGMPVQRKFIGSSFQFASYTQEIKAIGDSIVCLKQIGKNLSLEAYNSSRVLLWKKSFANNKYLKAKSLNIYNNSIYISYYSLYTDSLPTYTTDSTSCIYISNIDASGNEVYTDSLYINAPLVFPLEMEVYNGVPFILYTNGVSNFIVKNDNGFSTALKLESSNGNCLFNGNINVLNYSDTSLLYFASNGVINITPSTLDTSYIYNFSSPHVFYDNCLINNRFYLAGSNLNEGKVYSFDNSMSNIVWSKSYPVNSCVYSIKQDSSQNVYGVIVSEDSLLINKLSSINGDEIWRNGFKFQNSCIPLDIEVSRDFVAIGAESYSVTGGTNALIAMIDVNNEWVNYTYYNDELNENSFAKTLQVNDKNEIWVGGAFNSVLKSKQGFIYILNSDSTYVTSFNKNVYASIGLFPNPVHNKLYVQNSTNSILTYKIIDISGKLCLHTNNLKNNFIDMSNLSPGIYIISIENVDDKQVNYYKIIKE